MEVHHHPHVPTHVKPWKEYLLEGIMIFIAVSFGYTAENIREHYIETKKAVMGLRDMKNIKEMTDAMIKVNSIENQADDVFDMSIEKLFEQENDFKIIIKKREIYQVLEIATDKIEDVSNVIESIIIKYA